MHWHVRRACEMCRILGPDPDLQSQILCFAKILADVYLHYSLGSSFISFKGYFHSLISKRLIVRWHYYSLKNFKIWLSLRVVPLPGDKNLSGMHHSEDKGPARARSQEASLSLSPQARPPEFFGARRSPLLFRTGGKTTVPVIHPWRAEAGPGTGLIRICSSLPWGERLRGSVQHEEQRRLQMDSQTRVWHSRQMSHHATPCHTTPHQMKKLQRCRRRPNRLEIQLRANLKPDLKLMWQHK